MKNLSTEKWAEYRAYTANQIANATVDWEPYWHVLVEDTLHPELFVLVEQEWPDFETISYDSNPQGYNQNRKIYNPAKPDGPVFWYEYCWRSRLHNVLRFVLYSIYLEY